MRFTGERSVPAPIDVVWASLHDPEVLQAVVPGCAELRPLDHDTYAAALQARVGRIADTYRGTFSITDVRRGAALRVRVKARGRFGGLEVDLAVLLAEGRTPGSTSLRYDAEAAVSGLVSRLGRPALTVAAGHFTGGFFRDLARCASSSETGRRLASIA